MLYMLFLLCGPMMLGDHTDLHSIFSIVVSQACFLRGLNPVTMKMEDMVHWLTQWISVSEAVDTTSLSLLLHCPILLGYNQPSNWILIH
jgi:hypothetical protein